MYPTSIHLKFREPWETFPIIIRSNDTKAAMHCEPISKPLWINNKPTLSHAVSHYAAARFNVHIARSTLKARILQLPKCSLSAEECCLVRSLE